MKRHETIKVSTWTEGSAADESWGTRGLYPVTLVLLNSIHLLPGPAGNSPVNHSIIIYI